MAAALIEPDGKNAGRVTITSTLTSLIPPFFAIFVVVVLALLEIVDKETAGAVVLGILATSGLTSATVYQTAKKTPTDQVRTAVTYDQVTPAYTPPVYQSGPVEAVEEPLDTSNGDAAAQLRAELTGEGGRV